MVYIDDRNMVIEDNSGEWNPDHKEIKIVKKDVVHYDRIVKIKQELREEAEAAKFGVPSIEQMMEQLGIPTEKQKQLLEHDIPLPSNVNYGSMTEEEIESLVPSVAEIMEEMLKHPEKGKPSTPTVEADGLPSTEDIAAAMGVKLPKESV